MINSISLKPVGESTINDVFAIKSHPDIKRHQFRITSNTFSLLKKSWLEGYSLQHGYIDECHVIKIDDAVVGYIQAMIFNNHNYCNLGWDLLPMYWGRGIMAKCVNDIMRDRGKAYGIQRFSGACFFNNTRCIRLFNRLGFGLIETSWIEQVGIMYQERSFKWIKKYELRIAQQVDSAEASTITVPPFNPSGSPR